MCLTILCSLSFCCFFFQAEDGIRDYKVTGVQTCALPIYKKPVLISQTTNTRAVAFESVTMKAEPFALTASVPAFGADPRTRSEERRVGKECRAGRSQ